MADLRHLAVIMDGNSRWAKATGVKTEVGHYQGYKAAFNLVKHALGYKIKELTLFVLSQENIQNRSSFEIKCLEKILLEAIVNQSDFLVKNNIAVKFIGDYQVFGSKTQAAIEDLVSKTSNGNDMQLNLALNYSGRWHIKECIKALQNKQDLTDEMIDKFMQQQISECDLLIRTGNEFRVSNFILWHLSYAELYFSSTLWPDFNQCDLDIAVEWFNSRLRRFGGREQ